MSLSITKVLITICFFVLLILGIVYFSSNNRFFKKEEVHSFVNEKIQNSHEGDFKNEVPIVSSGGSTTMEVASFRGPYGDIYTRTIKLNKPSEPIKAIYMSSWVAGTPSVRSGLVKLVEETELNAIVIDVKDNTGELSWDGRVKDLDAFIKELNEKNIYTIARIASFQDPKFVAQREDLAVKNKQSGKVWRDNKGEPWIDTGSHEMWDYLVDIGLRSYAIGFDELNYDYIRFPTDGQLSLMEFPVSKERAVADKRGVVREFYAHLNKELSKKGIPISGDIFGIVLTNPNETKTLGQDLRDALVYFDYVAPMVYPSHYYAGTAGYKNPAEYPGEIITFATLGAYSLINSMIEGCVIERPALDENCEDDYRSEASSTKVKIDKIASSTDPQVVASGTMLAKKDKFLDGELELYSQFTESDLKKKIRHWYQDFDMGATYTADMVKAQILAGEKLGLEGFMLWDPSNKYTKGALRIE